jgi:hypothetical protein
MVLTFLPVTLIFLVAMNRSCRAGGEFRRVTVFFAFTATSGVVDDRPRINMS